MSWKGVIGSVGSAFNSGLNIGTGRGFMGGGAGTMLTMGAIGAGVAASTVATMSDGSIDPISAGAVGGIVGASAIPMAGITAGVVGSGIVGAAKAAPSVIGALGSGALAASPYVAGVGAIAGAKIGSAVWGVGSRLIDWNENADAFNKVKLSGPITGVKNGKGIGGKISGALINGKTLLGATALTEGARKAYGTYERAHMGTNMGVQNMTPRVPAYADNAGATGDLVFALNANRRG